MLLDPVQFLGKYLTCDISTDCQLIVKDLSPILKSVCSILTAAIFQIMIAKLKCAAGVSGLIAVFPFIPCQTENYLA